MRNMRSHSTTCRITRKLNGGSTPPSSFTSSTELKTNTSTSKVTCSQKSSQIIMVLINFCVSNCTRPYISSCLRRFFSRTFLINIIVSLEHDCIKIETLQKNIMFIRLHYFRTAENKSIWHLNIILPFCTFFSCDR